MTEFTSDIKKIPYADSDIYVLLSDLRNLDKLKDKIPQDKMQELTYDQDSCSVSVNPIGKIKFTVTEREANSTIKFQADQVPFGLNLWIQLQKVSPMETELKLTVNADLNPFLKPMVSKPLQQALDKMAEMLAALPYDQLEK